ncbi:MULTISPECIES: hypothetical protein [Mesorhizobium]|uniref:hypothetical protein n=1 Tax=Mesorhizobium sp. WSM3876 TaxID=422277 RepID=UPI002477D451|nr:MULTISPECIES: hypothetical protein [Mesorhizobium]
MPRKHGDDCLQELRWPVRRRSTALVEPLLAIVATMLLEFGRLTKQVLDARYVSSIQLERLAG